MFTGAIIKEPDDPELVELCPECYLEHHLFQNKSKLHPPRGPNGKVLDLSCSIVVKELMDMSVKDEVLHVMAWIRLIWWDVHTQWDPDIFGVREIRLPPRDLWVPDMTLGNSITTFEIYEEDTNLPIIIGFDGFRYWSIPSIIKTKCKANVVYFPFDFQVCRIHMGSWTYHNKMLNVKLSKFQTGLEGYVGNIEWEIIHVQARANQKPPLTNHPLYPNDTIYYTDIEYSLILKRKPYFYVHSLIVPSLLLAWLGAVIFLLPNECGEKLSFATTLFLALYVNQVVVSEFLPPSADSYPLIAKFYTLISVMLGTSIFFTASTLMLHFRLIPAMPNQHSWIYKMLHLLEHIGTYSFFVAVGKAHQKLCRTPNDSTISETKSRVGGIKFPPEPRGSVSKANRNGNFKVNDYISYNQSYLTNSQNCTSNGTKHLPKKDNDFILDSSSGVEYQRVNSPNFSQFPYSSDLGKTEADVNENNNESSTDRYIATCSPTVNESLKKIVSKLEIIAKDDSAEIALKRWRLIAAGFDRILFVIYILQLTIVTCYFGALVWDTDLLLGDRQIQEALNSSGS